MRAVRLRSRLATPAGILPAGSVVELKPGEAALLIRVGCAEALPAPAPSSPPPAGPAGETGAASTAAAPDHGDAAGGDGVVPPPAAPAKRPAKAKKAKGG